MNRLRVLKKIWVTNYISDKYNVDKDKAKWAIKRSNSLVIKTIENWIKNNTEW